MEKSKSSVRSPLASDLRKGLFVMNSSIFWMDEHRRKGEKCLERSAMLANVFDYMYVSALYLIGAVISWLLHCIVVCRSSTP